VGTQKPHKNSQKQRVVGHLKYTTYLLVAMLVLVPASAYVKIKSADSLDYLSDIYFEIYTFPSFDICKVGETNGNLTIPDYCGDVWVFLQASGYISVFTSVGTNDTIYLSRGAIPSKIIDATCGISCSSPKELTKLFEGGGGCECLCPKSCPPNTIQDENCNCRFPLMSGLVYDIEVPLYSQFISYLRVAKWEGDSFVLANNPQSCSISVYGPNDQIVKSTPCSSFSDGAAVCSFSVDDDFISGEQYDGFVKCGGVKRDVEFKVVKPQTPDILNALVLMARNSQAFVGYIILGVVIMMVVIWE